MNLQLKIEDLDGVKLTQEDNFPPLIEIQTALDHAFSQGSQGWGVTREVGVYLFLARELHEATALAATADENKRMLKGAQLEMGRVKKQLKKEQDAGEVLSAELVAERLLVKKLEESLDTAILAQRAAEDQERLARLELTAAKNGLSEDDLEELDSAP